MPTPVYTVTTQLWSAHHPGNILYEIYRPRETTARDPLEEANSRGSRSPASQAQLGASGAAGDWYQPAFKTQIALIIYEGGEEGGNKRVATLFDLNRDPMYRGSTTAYGWHPPHGGDDHPGRRLRSGVHFLP